MFIQHCFYLAASREVRKKGLLLFFSSVNKEKKTKNSSIKSKGKGEKRNKEVQNDEEFMVSIKDISGDI